METIYCLKCKIKTVTTGIERVVTKNHRNAIRGFCATCGTKKYKFVSLVGSGFLNDAIGNLGDLGIELHLAAEKGENVTNGSFNNLQKYSYAGPGTKYTQRDREGYQGINELDRMAKLHDKFYN